MYCINENDEVAQLTLILSNQSSTSFVVQIEDNECTAKSECINVIQDQ